MTNEAQLQNIVYVFINYVPNQTSLYLITLQVPSLHVGVHFPQWIRRNIRILVFLTLTIITLLACIYIFIFYSTFIMTVMYMSSKSDYCGFVVLNWYMCYLNGFKQIFSEIFNVIFKQCSPISTLIMILPLILHFRNFILLLWN